MAPITQQMLDQALDAWRTARQQALLEQQAWATLIQSHGELIDSLQACGHTWSQVSVEQKKLMDAHQEALQNAWKNMDERSRDYQQLLSKHKAQ